jgi:hypothetical protein
MGTKARTRYRIMPKYKDDKKDKFFPNGIAATVRGMQQYWPNVNDSTKPVKLTADEFLSMTNFIDKYTEATEPYSAIAKRSRTRESIKGMILDVGRPQGNISFYQLRAFATFVGLPTGLFLLFTQLVSEERRDRRERKDPRVEAMKLIRGVRAFADAAEDYVRSRKEEDIFSYSYDSSDDTSYLADMHALKQFSDAYSLGREQPDRGKEATDT